MAKQQIETITCDLCGYGGELSRPQDFTSTGGVDLCRWCASDRPMRSTSCGRHEVTFTQSGWGWSCSCGVASGPFLERVRNEWRVSQRVLDAVPNLLNATANYHVQNDA